MTFLTPWPGRYCCKVGKSACGSLTCFSFAVLSAWERAILSVRIVTNFFLFLLVSFAHFFLQIHDWLTLVCQQPFMYAKWVKSSMSCQLRISQVAFEVVIVPCHSSQHIMLDLTRLAATSKVYWVTAINHIHFPKMDKETVREEHERLHQEIKDLCKDLALARDNFIKFRQKLILDLIEEKQKQMKVWTTLIQQ